MPTEGKFSMIKYFRDIINYCKPLMSATFTIQRIFYCVARTDRDWLPVAGATFMNEYAPHAMLAPPFMRHPHQRFTVIDYSCIYL